MILLSNSKNLVQICLAFCTKLFFIITKEFDKLLQALYLSKEDLQKLYMSSLEIEGDTLLVNLLICLVVDSHIL